MTTMASQITSRLFTQPFIQTQIKENIKAPRHWPLCGEFTGTGDFPTQRASYAENVSIWWRHHVGQSIIVRSWKNRARHPGGHYWDYQAGGLPFRHCNSSEFHPWVPDLQMKCSDLFRIIGSGQRWIPLNKRASDEEFWSLFSCQPE